MAEYPPSLLPVTRSGDINDNSYVVSGIAFVTGGGEKDNFFIKLPIIPPRLSSSLPKQQYQQPCRNTLNVQSSYRDMVLNASTSNKCLEIILSYCLIFPFQLDIDNESNNDGDSSDNNNNKKNERHVSLTPDVSCMAVNRIWHEMSRNALIYESGKGPWKAVRNIMIHNQPSISLHSEVNNSSNIEINNNNALIGIKVQVQISALRLACYWDMDMINNNVRHYHHKVDDRLLGCIVDKSWIVDPSIAAAMIEAATPQRNHGKTNHPNASSTATSNFGNSRGNTHDQLRKRKFQTNHPINHSHQVRQEYLKSAIRCAQASVVEMASLETVLGILHLEEVLLVMPQYIAYIYMNFSFFLYFHY